MKRKQFLKTAGLGSAAALIGYPIFKAESAPQSVKFQYDQNRIEWSNSQRVGPYVDSNLWLRSNGSDIMTEVFDNSGVIDPFYGTNLEVIQMGIAGNEWPVGGRGKLRVTLIELSNFPPPHVEHILYENLTFQWVDGIIDHYVIDLSDYQQHDAIYTWKIECYTDF